MKIGIYIRLSDEDRFKIDNESESVKNQRKIINDYVKKNNYVITKEYVDDGYSGTNFDRPKFKEMIDDIKNGIINCIITKDMSRFGRNYAGVGYYLEEFFPTNNVRYISILDNYDSFYKTNEDIIPFKSILNDMVSKDTSKKVKSALDAKRKEGKFIGSCAPYGYKKSPEDKNKLIIDEYSSVIVKRIFNDYANGKGQTKIAKELTNENIDIPTIYKNRKIRKSVSSKHICNIWSTHTISEILRNKVYIGALEQHKFEKISYKINKTKKVDSDKTIIVYNTHEPIIDKKTFEIVQDILDQKSRGSSQKYYYLLTGLMRCEDCGGAICVRTNHYKNQKRFYTFCVRNHHSHKIACSGHNVNYEKLENYVLETLKKTLNNTIVNYEKIMANLKDKNTENLKNIQKLKNEVIILKSKKEKAYQDRLEDIISAEEYLKYAKNLDNEIDKINEQILDLKNQKSDNLNIEDLKKWLLNLEKPDKLLLKILIKKITINENKEIKIYLNFATN